MNEAGVGMSVTIIPSGHTSLTTYTTVTYGVPQSYLESKMGSAASDWTTYPFTQANCEIEYSQGKYDRPVAAGN